MSTNQINIKLLKLLHPTAQTDKLLWCDEDLQAHWEGRKEHWSLPGENWWRPIPNFCGDLNVIHSAEKLLLDGNSDLWEAYLDEHLPAVCDAADKTAECAPALERAQALLLTLCP